MNYRHIYHAGNFADVFKHWILTLLLEKLIQKPTRFFVLDTHAGLGSYNLQHLNAQKTLEQDSGIKKLMPHKLADDFIAYYNIVTQDNPLLAFYPGSPKIIQHYLRAADKLFAAELHPEDFLVLQANFNYDKRVKVLNQNGYQAIKALLPPAEKRGLIFIDPPFEITDEFAQIVAALSTALKRFAHGIYAIWYPIKDRTAVEKFYIQMANLPITKAFYIELHANALILNQLNSCGMLIINPPWQIEQTLMNNMPKLIEYLNFTRGTFTLKWLTI